MFKAEQAVAGRKAFPSSLHKSKQMNGVLLAFLLGCAGAAAIFLPFLIVDKGFFVYAGDYNQQQIPFYYYLPQFLRQGGGTWSWATDLGSSAINSYSFYNLGSPFLWISLLFPQSWMPYMMGPLFVLKFGCIAAAACLYLSRYARTRNMAVICSVIYALCGFNVYNIFFNHMLEPVIFFPLMLWAMDALMLEDKRGWFAIIVGFALINSYFFFVGNVVFLLFYYFVKRALNEYPANNMKLLQLAFEAILGVGIGMILLLPSVLNLMQNPRLSEYGTGMNLLVYGSSQQYFNILSSLFFPPDPPWDPNLFTEGSIKWTSMSAFLPIVGVAGVYAYCKKRHHTSVKWLLGISLLCAMVPILNSLFFALNSAYYARWYYMPILFMCFATLRSLEDADIDLKKGARFVIIVTAVFAVFQLIPNRLEDSGYGVARYPSRFWLTWLTALAAAVAFYLIVRFFRHKVRFAPILLGAVMGFSVFYSVIHISIGKFGQWRSDDRRYVETYEAATELELPDDGFYRIDVYYQGSNPDFDNLGLWLDKSCIQSFNSVVTPATMEFYDSIGLVRDVRSNPAQNLYALRGLLSVDYLLVSEAKHEDFLNPEEDDMLSYGWSLDSQQAGYYVYSNDNYLPLGFTYDQYLRMEYLTDMSNTDARTNLLVRGIGLTEEQAEQFGYLFEEEAIEKVEETDSEGNASVRYNYSLVSYDTYIQDVEDRRINASYETSYDASGFSVKISLDRENLVFFGVPYDDGFTATVNGEEVEILKVSGGMMAVLAPAGDNEIVFKYRTPGFRLGIAATALSFAVLLAYVLISRRWKKKQPLPELQATADAVLFEDPGEGASGFREQETATAGRLAEEPPCTDTELIIEEGIIPPDGIDELGT